MREIKFRAWNKEERKWLSANLHISVIDGLLWWQFGYSCDILSIEDREKLILLQYIGCKDKNNKEIYGGDIVQVGNAIGVVKYREELARFDVEGIHPSNCWFLMGIDKDWENASVIGNICENPELLKEGKK